MILNNFELLVFTLQWSCKFCDNSVCFLSFSKVYVSICSFYFDLVMFIKNEVFLLKHKILFRKEVSFCFRLDIVDSARTWYMSLKRWCDESNIHVHCTIYHVQCTMYNAQCTMNLNQQRSVHIMRYAHQLWRLSTTKFENPTLLSL